MTVEAMHVFLIITADSDADRKLFARLAKALEGDVAVRLSTMLDLLEGFDAFDQEEGARKLLGDIGLLRKPPTTEG